ncbi:hypothetical protein CDD83_10748 [Cordyceps sp. RAO-2017]|nr:hypothetical protein CDD83_10748 [Cordyceps sp. RAO-2017]
MEDSSTPLADYFWIAGVETISYDDALLPIHLPVGSTISEHGEPDENFVNGYSKSLVARHSRQSSANRLSKVSVDGRFSISTLDELDGNTRSNRSSATIRPVRCSPSNGAAAAPNGSCSPADGGHLLQMGDFDFDSALIKFAAERENFLEDLSFSAGAKTQARPPMINPRAERIRAEEGSAGGRVSPLKSIKGSIRRKISFRDMSSVRKQPSSARQGPSSRAGSCPTL